METIRSGFLMLLPEERELLTLYYLEDLEYEEICGVLGIGYDVLRTRLVRARKHLREIVGNENGK
jgi:DNA-directed RNA polymerase specialized sigma24 family protein